MIGLFIPNEKMPETCFDCPCFRQDSIDGIQAFQCQVTLETEWQGNKIKGCTIQEVDRE